MSLSTYAAGSVDVSQDQDRFSIHLAILGPKVVKMYWLFNYRDDAEAE